MSVSNVQFSGSNNLFKKDQEIKPADHPAWQGKLTKTEAETLLKMQNTPHAYLLREGEAPGEFCLSFLQPDLTPHHCSFALETSQHRWFYRNGEYHDALTLDRLISMMMHCREGEGNPIVQKS